jgi:hypothetical protein
VCTGGRNDDLRLEGSNNDDVLMGASDNCLFVKLNEVCGLVEGETTRDERVHLVISREAIRPQLSMTRIRSVVVRIARGL